MGKSNEVGCISGRKKVRTSKGLKKRLADLKTRFGVYLTSQGLQPQTVIFYLEQLDHLIHFILTETSMTDDFEFTPELIKDYRESLSMENEPLNLLIQMCRLLTVERFLEFLLPLLPENRAFQEDL